MAQQVSRNDWTSQRKGRGYCVHHAGPLAKICLRLAVAVGEDIGHGSGGHANDGTGYNAVDDYKSKTGSEGMGVCPECEEEDGAGDSEAEVDVKCAKAETDLVSALICMLLNKTW